MHEVALSHMLPQLKSSKKITGGGKGGGLRVLGPSAACVVSTFLKPKLLLVIKFKTNIFIRLNHVYVCYQVDYQI